MIDCLSQYEKGSQEGESEIFKNYLRQHWKSQFDEKFPTPIKASKRSGKSLKIEDGADAIYYGIRCGILHEAHVKLYTGLLGQNNIIQFHRSGFTKYSSDGADCPTVTVDPGKLFDAIHKRFEDYLKELTNTDRKFDSLRNNFKNKFEFSYGVTISTDI